ncbi:MAG: sulfatase-like hydrolase/transferase [Acidobacteriota bacterium]
MADTLRFDHATAELMPEISTDFAGSLRFERAYSPASWTLPSVASIFSGELPARMRGPDGSLISLPTRTSTLAEELSERGYATVGITANYTVHHENHYSAGFDLFLVPDPKVGQFADITWLRQLALEAASWLDDEDLFLYLQPMEAHDPYRNHETGEALPAPHTGDIVSEAELAALRRAYASEAGYLSRELSRLREELPAFDLEILTSDHGEEFFEHGGFRHGPALYPESVHVPLWIQGAGLSAGQIDQPVSLVGLKDAVVAAAEGVLLGDLTEASLAPLMEERPVTAETFSFGPPRWSLIRDDRQAIFFARPAPPKPAEHPVERWLLEHQPRVLVAPLDGETLDPTERSLMARSVRSLIDQFAGWRRGLYLLFEDGSGGTVRIRGVENEGLVWGDAERIEVSPDGAGLRLDVTSASPFALVLLPALEGEQPTVELAGQKIELEGSTPIRHAGGSVVLWLDAGRPKEEALEVESTLERLRALSYI